MKYNKKQIENIRRNLLLCKPFQEKGIFRVDRSESLKHNLKLAYQFIVLSYEGFCIAVRPELKNGNKPDLMVLNTKKPIIKEIMVSETDERFNSKDYLGIQKIKVKVKEK